MALRFRVLTALLVCVAGCSGPSAIDLDAGIDAGVDAAPGPADASAARDAPSLDARTSPDAGTDAGRDAATAATDAWPTPIAELVREAYCDVAADAACLGSACGCATPCGSPRGLCPNVDYFEAYIGTFSLTLDEAARRDCLETQRNGYRGCLPEPVDIGLLRACTRMLRSSIPIGMPCGLLHVCADGEGLCDPATNVCERAPGVSEPCFGYCRGELACFQGTCIAARARGETCEDDEDCASPLRCSQGRCGPAAIDEACVVDADCGAGLRCTGGLCGGSTLGARCDGSPSSCGGSAECLPDPSSPHRCQAPATEGLLCAHGAFGPSSLYPPCGPGLECESYTHRCRAAPAVGEPCRGACAVGARCVLVGAGPARTCVATAPDGASCGAGVYCDLGHHCVGGTCRAAGPGDGEPCETGSCGNPLPWAPASTYCDLSGVCRARLPIGGSCVSGNWCQAGLACASGSCAPDPSYLRPGDACDGASHCPEGTVCRGYPPGPGTCAPPPMLGEECTGLCAGGASCGLDPRAGGHCHALLCESLP